MTPNAEFPSSIALLLKWLLRVAQNPSMRGPLISDPVLFASWYAAAESLIPWPPVVQAIQQAERDRSVTLEERAAALRTLSATLMAEPSPEQARLLTEGYEVHEWVRANAAEFEELLAQMDRGQPAMVSLVGLPGVHAVTEVLALSELEHEVLSFVFLHSVFAPLEGLLRSLTYFLRVRAAEDLWCSLFDTTASDLKTALGAGSPLRRSGLLKAGGRDLTPARMGNFWLRALASKEPLFSQLLEPLARQAGHGEPARLVPEDRDLAVAVLQNCGAERGVNILLYGAARLDRAAALQALVVASGRRAWRVREHGEATSADAPSQVYVAQRLLAQQHGTVLVVDRPTDVLVSGGSSAWAKLFGMEADASPSATAQDEAILAANPIPTLWLGATAGELPPAIAARFVLHVPLQAASRKEREAALRELLAEHALPPSVRDAVLQLESVSSAQVAAAVRAAELANKTDDTERGAVVLHAIEASQKSMGRNPKAQFKESVTAYSLDYLNLAGRFQPKDILKCLEQNPKGSLALYGPPGTGKTQFVEFLAQQLGLPLVSRKASDLLSKWVGETEKNIAAAFEEAQAESAMLFFDEGDSFLRDRSSARESWEVTQVNEMLQRIERFDGIVVLATNLFEGLDAAALRRFTFKLEFQALSAEQRWAMFLQEAKVVESELATEIRVDWWERLMLMPQLAAGDFATVKRQSLMLGVALEPGAWLDQLAAECAVKRPVRANGRG